MLSLQVLKKYDSGLLYIFLFFILPCLKFHPKIPDDGTNVFIFPEQKYSRNVFAKRQATRRSCEEGSRIVLGGCRRQGRVLRQIFPEEFHILTVIETYSPVTSGEYARIPIFFSLGRLDGPIMPRYLNDNGRELSAARTFLRFFLPRKPSASSRPTNLCETRNFFADAGSPFKIAKTILLKRTKG